MHRTTEGKVSKLLEHTIYDVRKSEKIVLETPIDGSV